ncbi:MAG TPA: hypothetical protein ENN69_00975, partial [Spirochaetia bacterium]|nr:hypothetical protein [Spirochaetia bacterium]
MSAIVADLMRLAALICGPKHRLKDEEIFFMTATLFALSQSVDIQKKDQVCEILNRFSGASDVRRVKKLWPIIKGFFPGNADINSLTLPSFRELKKYDAAHGTSHFDLVRNNFSRFVHSLIKADGTVSADEKEMEKRINRVLFPAGGPPEEEEENSTSIFSLFDLKNKGGTFSLEGGKAGITLTFGGGNINLGDIFEKVEEAEAEDERTETAGSGGAGEEVIPAEDLETVIAELNCLIGLSNIKEQITTLINLLKIKKERQERGLPETEMTLHSVFFGSPGTGKT